MTSNLLLAHPLTNLSAATITSDSDVGAPGKGVGNVIHGGRQDYYELAAASASFDVRLDNSDSFAANTIIVGNADWLFKVGDPAGQLDIDVDADNAGSYTNSIFTTSLTSGELVGPRQTDYVETWTAGSSYNYHQITFSLFDSALQRLSYCYLCSSFDFGYDPVTRFSVTMPAEHRFERHKPKSFGLVWRGVTDAKLREFLTGIYKVRSIAPVFLHEASEASLSGDALICCRMVSIRHTAKSSTNNEIRIEFEEVV